MSDLLITRTELTSLANAIRAYNGTSGLLEYPNGFISTINNIDLIEKFNQDPIAMSIINKTLTSITDNNLTKITPFLFYNFSQLSYVSFPNCTEIGSHAFDHTGLTKLDFPFVRKVGQDVIYSSPVSIINLPLLNEMEEAAFHNASVININFPLITNIPSYAFAVCTANTVSFAKCKIIKGHAFTGFFLLYSNSAPIPYFPLCEEIEQYAFETAHYITTLSFPRLKFLHYGAFKNCYSLTSLYLPGSTVVTIDYDDNYKTMFLHTFMLDNLTPGIFVPSSLYDTYCNTLYWSQYSNIIASITTVGE